MMFEALTLLAIASTALAQLLIPTAPTTTGQNTSQSFLIKTHLPPHQSTTTNLIWFNNLYLSASRTGAGTSDAVFTSKITSSLQAFFNSASPTSPPTLAPLNFIGASYPFAFAPTRTAYAGWSFVQVNAGDDGAVVWKESLEYAMDGFGGWMVCDWWHGMPQLFVRWTVVPAVAVPMGCAVVELRKVWI